MLDSLLTNLDWSVFVRTFGTLFAVASPIGAIPFFLGYTAGQSSVQRRHSARAATLTMLIALVVIIVFGTSFLNVFGITVDGFKVGGGFVILLSGIGMVRAKVQSMKVEIKATEGTEHSALSVVSPFAIPLVIGPGAFSAIVLGMHELPGPSGYLVVSAACVALMVIMFLALRLADPIFRLLGDLGMNIMVRLMGLVIIIISFETILSGAKAQLPGLG